MTSPALPCSIPVVPGGGPRWIGDRAAARARNRWWMRWWWSSAALGVIGAGLLAAVLVVADPTDVLFAWFACWIAAVLAMVPAHRLGWAQRYDRYDDELCRYADGVRAGMSLRTSEGVVRLGDRTVAVAASDAAGRRRVELEEGTVSLEERVLERDDDGIRTVAVRLVDEGGAVRATARGERRGDRVDWTAELPLGELRLRQLLPAVPRRRTLLDREGRAWRVLADADAPAWTVVLPERAGAVDAVFVTWFACHLDALGLEHCYGERGGPALTVSDGAMQTGVDDTRWRPVGSPGVRPDVPMASASEIDL